MAPLTRHLLNSVFPQRAEVLQEEPDVLSGLWDRVRADADVAGAGRREHGGQHGVPEPGGGAHPDREPAHLRPGQEVTSPGALTASCLK